MIFSSLKPTINNTDKTDLDLTVKSTSLNAYPGYLSYR